MAFYGSLGEVNLGALDQSTIDNATDIFVYDTSKDSDGGAWRNRTQNTSWYKETLNTATRGSRREFPAVAVIVVETKKVTIYDGDDPDLPMWMVFTIINYPTGANYAGTPKGIGYPGISPAAIAAGNGITAVSMKNGQMFICNNNGLVEIAGWSVNFLNEVMYEYLRYPTITDGTSRWLLSGNVSQRNDSPTNTSSPSTRYGSSTVNGIRGWGNDVAITVLPSAPIDLSTGLPTPTIAVATQGGVSVIKDDGSVVDLRLSNSYNVEFTDDYKLVANINTENSTFSTHIYDAIPSTDSNTNGNRRYYRTGTGVGSIPSLSGNNPEGTANETRVLKDNLIAIPCAGNAGGTIPALNILQDNSTSQSNGMVAYVTSDYNTGWMHGDIKGAFLSDTDATNVTGTELWPEGDFADANEWTSAGAEWTISGGTATVSDGNGGYSFLGSSSGTLTNGKKYVLSFTVSNYSGGRLEASQANSGNIQIPFSANGSYSQLINYTGTSGSGLGMYGYGGGAVGFTLDNLYLRELEEEDRSVNNTGLAVYGTITKSAVVTGAELVAYSGFTDNDYLKQPYNSDLDFGTGDYYMSIWAKGGGSDQCLMIREHGTADDDGAILFFQSSGKYIFYSRQNGTTSWTAFSATNATYGDYWSHLVMVRTGGTLYGYVNGKLEGSTSFAGDVSNNDAEIYIGRRHPSVNNTQEYSGSLALARIGGSAPSAEQIKKIYEDEKVLFQENAACTLYGSSDVVTALAYDDKTNLLHVGTSSGRSDFQGLRRINNTTTAVSRAISASNGLIAEQ